MPKPIILPEQKAPWKLDATELLSNTPMKDWEFWTEFARLNIGNKKFLLLFGKEKLNHSVNEAQTVHAKLATLIKTPQRILETLGLKVHFNNETRLNERKQLRYRSSLYNLVAIEHAILTHLLYLAAAMGCNPRELLRDVAERFGTSPDAYLEFASLTIADLPGHICNEIVSCHPMP